MCQAAFSPAELRSIPSTRWRQPRRKAKAAGSGKKLSAKAKAATKKEIPTGVGRANSKITHSKLEAKKTRQLDAAVKEVLRKWAPNLTHKQKFSNVVDGETLFEFVSKRKCELAKLGQYFPHDFWDKTCAKYSIDTSVKLCAVKDEKEKVDASLVSAITACDTKNMKFRGKSGLIAFLKQSREINQRTLCGLISQLSSCTPSASVESATMILEFIRLALKKKLHTQFKEDSFFASNNCFFIVNKF